MTKICSAVTTNIGLKIKTLKCGCGAKSLIRWCFPGWTTYTFMEYHPIVLNHFSSQSQTGGGAWKRFFILSYLRHQFSSIILKWPAGLRGVRRKSWRFRKANLSSWPLFPSVEYSMMDYFIVQRRISERLIKRPFLCLYLQAYLNISAFRLFFP